MNLSNILRVSRTSIKEYFVHEFAGIGDEMDYYVHVSLPQAWLKNYGHNSIRKINVPDYEETLIKFIENPDNISPNHPLLIIIGGAGTGKSTTIKYALSKANICKGCVQFDTCSQNYPARIHIDFLNFKNEASAHSDFEFNKRNYEKEIIERFWSFISAKLTIVINKKLSLQQETTEFWNWLLSGECNGQHSHIFNKRLEAFSHLFENPSDNRVELTKKRENLLVSFSQQETVYYKLYQIAFLRLSSNVNCNLIIFDNIDRLDPGIQTEIINFTLEANRAFECKAIIPMRPHTFHLNRDASNCIEVIEHCIPDIGEVLTRRLGIFEKKKGEAEVLFCMRRIIDEIMQNSTMKEVYYQSAGSSIRFAIRNLYNLFLSNLIVTHKENKIIDKFEFNSNIFFQSLFCSEDSEERLFENNFVNIFSINKNVNLKELSNIKLRALYYVNINYDLEVRDLVNHLLDFGYSTDDILLVINEFLDNKKPLIWSNSLLEFDADTLALRKPQRFFITPMGAAYINILISHPSYLFECVYAIDSNYKKNLQNNLKKLFEFIKQLYDKDYLETKEYCLCNGVNKYKKTYTSTLPSITAILFFKMYQNFSHLSRNTFIEKFDIYGNFIVKQITILLEELEHKEGANGENLQ